MRTTTILAMAVLGCCCLVSDAFVIGSHYRLNPNTPLIARRRTIPGFGRAIIFNPTKGIRGRASQVKEVAPTPEVPRVQPAQKVEPPVSPRPHPQTVHPQAPARRQPFGGNTIIIIREDTPKPRADPSLAQAQGTVGPASSVINSPASVYDHASSQSSLHPYSATLPTDVFPAADLNYADPFADPFLADPFFDHSMASADPFSYSRHQPIPAPAAQTGVSPQVHPPEPNSHAGAGPYSGGPQHGYDPFDNMLRMQMLAEMDLPYFGEPHSMYRPTQTHGTPASQGKAQPPAPKSPTQAQLSVQDKYDQLYALHLAEALDLPTPPGQEMSGNTNNANTSPADSPKPVASQAAAAPAEAAATPTPQPTSELTASAAASPVDKAAATSAGGSNGYHPYDLYLREALDLPPVHPMHLA